MTARSDEDTDDDDRPIIPLTVERFSARQLEALVPGTTRRLWLDELAPALVAAGVLTKLGRGWYGRRSEIETALLDPTLLDGTAPTSARGKRGR